ncbi:MAG: hypothetical protein WAL32_14650, partial [Terriglobales bacterium]
NVATDEAGNPLGGLVGITFSLYNNARGGEPLWAETQNVQLDSTGHYSVYLGITQANGVPISLFSTGQAHWLGVKPQGQAEEPRVFLVSVPYAMKAGDAATVGGLPPSAFVLAAPGGTSDAASGSSPSAPSAEPTPAGTGTQNYIPIWTDNTGDLGNSVLYQLGTGASAKIGINETKPLFTLDVNGEELMRGLFEMATTGFATASQGFISNPLNLESSAYNSSTKKYTLNHFQWQAEPAGNDTTSPGATLNLLYGTDPAAPAETGLQLSSKGIFTFASGQTFPGTGNGTITGVTAGTDLTGGGTSGKVTLNLDTTKVPQLASDNTFSGLQTINNAVIVSGANANGALQVTNAVTSGDGPAIFALAESSDTNGIESFLTANSGSGAAVSGESFSQSYGVGVQGGGGTGVLGTSTLIPYVGVRGIAIGASNTGVSLGSAGVWGDSNTSGFAGVLGTADDGYGGLFSNNSKAPTLSAVNASFNRSGVIFETDGSDIGGVCTIDVSGNLQCNGSKSAVVPVDGGAHKVALYAVEAPENWFEDFGSGHLANGAASVTFDSIYVQTVNTTTEYHVFLTPRGDCEGLYVADETPAGFEVRELHHGASNVDFDYRIVAKRSGYENIRLADFTERYKGLALQHEKMRQRRRAQQATQP